MLSYESRPEWDTNISSVGGKKDVLLVKSPWSDNPSANSTQGSLTSGVLTNEFEPPEIIIEPAVNGYYYQNRLNMADVNQRIATLNRIGTTDTVDPEKVAKQTETYIAPSRRSVKHYVNNSRSGRKETYNPGIPGLADSQYHHEAFENKADDWIVTCLVIIVICVCCPVLVVWGCKSWKWLKQTFRKQPVEQAVEQARPFDKSML